MSTSTLLFFLFSLAENELRQWQHCQALFFLPICQLLVCDCVLFLTASIVFAVFLLLTAPPSSPFRARWRPVVTGGTVRKEARTHARQETLNADELQHIAFFPQHTLSCLPGSKLPQDGDAIQLPFPFPRYKMKAFSNYMALICFYLVSFTKDSASETLLISVFAKEQTLEKKKSLFSASTLVLISVIQC